MAQTILAPLLTTAPVRSQRRTTISTRSPHEKNCCHPDVRLCYVFAHERLRGSRLRGRGRAKRWKLLPARTSQERQLLNPDKPEALSHPCFRATHEQSRTPRLSDPELAGDIDGRAGRPFDRARNGHEMACRISGRSGRGTPLARSHCTRSANALLRARISSRHRGMPSGRGSFVKALSARRTGVTESGSTACCSGSSGKTWTTRP